MDACRRRAPRAHLAAWGLSAAIAMTACDQYAAADAGVSATPQLTPAAPAPVPGGCGDVGTTDPAAVVDLLHRDDGGCVAAAEAVLARCDPTLDPLALLDLAGAPRRYLGGRFAVPVAAVPIGATSLGTSVAGRVWVGPEDPPGLYLESSAGVERWLPLPARRQLYRPPTITMIGDSILDGAAPTLTETLADWTVSIDAGVGRGSYDAAALAEALPEPIADVVVVQIGVNDHDAGALSSNQDRVLAAVDAADLVIWVTAHGPDVAVPAINEAIVAGMGALPDGVVADWDRWVPQTSLSSDGVHPDTGNGALLADLVVPLLTDWRQAVWGGGPARCVEAVTAAVVG